ncbi:putative spermidine/putrescine transport system ATP-binding protein [Quadrisphaera granulorum]|uniref:Putative spermidine/putrescine transport system ATP-binding protein n=1 Tax=Quadrisphaera granulorum TaxID=317664 RepID=A0A315ZRH9_9ACTN|nr:ABC transporter ATP-binding protein [Quadrisphaera granulorum]PWJ47733.1 putative spermidine/putrescine transport system ATP-binding protein [Quadrisphaera granulorum]SZE98687.1 putative spermidine/putrescine transport system ATP-binding protein [Quadrisphaera granulorum]
MSGSPTIRLRGLSKHFGGVKAVDAVDLDVRAGEFFSMLGPSGSGKTTVLRLVAGFEQPTSGSVELFGDDVTAKAAFERDVSTVFQDYALFPHMTVLDNVAYGLRVRGVRPRQRRERALQALEAVQLAHAAQRKPTQLSGGQRQRVALARASVVEPKVMLLDEPLGALDLKLREQMQVELKQIQRNLGITFVFVTHDQEEALSLSDRVAVFNNGRIEQLGTPRELYENPASLFVADFVGTSNLFTDEHAVRLIGRQGAFSIRPERLRLVTDPHAGAGNDTSGGRPSAPGTVVESIYVGSAVRCVVDLDDGPRVTVLEHNDGSRREERVRGGRIHVVWQDDDVVALVPAAS